MCTRNWWRIWTGINTHLLVHSSCMDANNIHHYAKILPLRMVHAMNIHSSLLHILQYVSILYYVCSDCRLKSSTLYSMLTGDWDPSTSDYTRAVTNISINQLILLNWDISYWFMTKAMLGLGLNTWHGGLFSIHLHFPWWQWLCPFDVESGALNCSIGTLMS